MKRAELNFAFKNVAEAEIFVETIKTYPKISSVCAVDIDTTCVFIDGTGAAVVTVDCEGKDNIGVVLRELSMAFVHGPAVGRYKWKAEEK